MALNCYPAVLFTKLAIPNFKKRGQKGNRSLITWTSGMAAVSTSKYAHLYSGTKIYTDFLALGLEYELSGYNIDCTSWRCNGVAEQKVSDAVSADDYVKQALNKCTSGIHYGHWYHELIGEALEAISYVVPFIKSHYMD